MSLPVDMSGGKSWYSAYALLATGSECRFCCGFILGGFILASILLVHQTPVRLYCIYTSCRKQSRFENCGKNDYNWVLCGKTAMNGTSVYWRKSEHKQTELLLLTRRFQLNCPSFKMTSSKRVTTLPRSTMTSSSPRRIMTSSWHRKSHFRMYIESCWKALVKSEEIDWSREQ